MARFGRSNVTGGGGGGGMAGAAPRGYNSASGGIPGVTSPIDTVTGNLGGISDIINSLTSTSSGALREQYPDEYFNVLGTLLGNTQRRASGDISDLLPELQQGAAESAVAGGLSGSGAENTKLLRDMGLTRYGVQNQAIDALSKIQGQIPTVRPFDPSSIIGSQMDAQERADIYASAPVPEDAYQRAMAAARAGGGGGGTPGKTYSGGGGGGAGRPVRTVDSSLSWGPNMPPQSGMAMNPFGTSSGFEPAPFGTNFGGGGLPRGFWDDPVGEFDTMLEDNPLTVTPWAGWGGGAANPVTDDFGGSLNYGGGEPWQDYDFADPLGVGLGVFGGDDYANSQDYYDDWY